MPKAPYSDNYAIPDHVSKRRSKLAAVYVGWLRAAVLGANDGLVSVGSLVFGIAASQASRRSIFVAAVAAWIAGAMSMAAGEYVSVSSRADTEKADLEMEQRELDRFPRRERKELAAIYIKRGLNPNLANEVATQLTQHDALQAHTRDEIGISKSSPSQTIAGGAHISPEFHARGCASIDCHRVCTPQCTSA